MPLSKGGKFNINPGAARMHDANAKPSFGHGDVKEKPIADPGQQEPTGHVEFHKGPGADGQGKYHTIHHPSGESKSHATAHGAHHAMNDHMKEDGCKGDGSCSEHGNGAQVTPDLADEPGESAGAEY
jgi:hypothetical protein